MELILVALCIPGHLRECKEQSGNGKKGRSSCLSGFTGISSRASPQPYPGCNWEQSLTRMPYVPNPPHSIKPNKIDRGALKIS